VFDSFSHHLVSLALLARSDDKFAAQEPDVIVRHCKIHALGGRLRNDAR
jgi:hypothetical protein